MATLEPASMGIRDKNIRNSNRRARARPTPDVSSPRPFISRDANIGLIGAVLGAIVGTLTATGVENTKDDARKAAELNRAFDNVGRELDQDQSFFKSAARSIAAEMDALQRGMPQGNSLGLPAFSSCDAAVAHETFDEIDRNFAENLREACNRIHRLSHSLEFRENYIISNQSSNTYIKAIQIIDGRSRTLIDETSGYCDKVNAQLKTLNLSVASHYPVEPQDKL